HRSQSPSGIEVLRLERTWLQLRAATCVIAGMSLLPETGNASGIGRVTGSDSGPFAGAAERFPLDRPPLHGPARLHHRPNAPDRRTGELTGYQGQRQRAEHHADRPVLAPGQGPVQTPHDPVTGLVQVLAL